MRRSMPIWLGKALAPQANPRYSGTSPWPFCAQFQKVSSQVFLFSKARISCSWDPDIVGACLGAVVSSSTPPPFSHTLSPISPPHPPSQPRLVGRHAGRCVVAEVVMEAPAPEPEEPVYVRELLPGVTAKGLGLCVQRVSSSEMD